jgi:uncharacterized phiE125 gp8 family phage protein
MYTLITPAIQSALTLAEAKTHLRVLGADEDSYIQALIETAQEMAEGYTGRVLIDSTWSFELDYFPAAIKLEKAPVSSITSIHYFDTEGVEQTLDASAYSIRKSEPAMIYPNEKWPETETGINRVKVLFQAGYATPAEVPAAIKSAMYLLIGHLYDNRSDAVESRQINELPKGSDYLLDRWKVY